MSVCTLIAADVPLAPVKPSVEYPVVIDLDRGTVDDGGADDAFLLAPFDDAEEYTGKAFAVSLDWNPTPGRARRVIDYIKEALTRGGCVEVWRVWLTDYVEFEDRPVIRRTRIRADALTPEQLLAIDSAETWCRPDKRNPNRPAHFCLLIEP